MSDQEYIPKKGRPKSYKPEFDEQILDLYKKGLTTTAICAELGVTKPTYYNWLKNEPSFKEAHEIGKTMAEAQWEELGIRGMCGHIKGFKSDIWRFMGHNQFKWSLKDESDSKSIHIHGDINTVNALQEKSTSELLERINKLQIELGTKVQDDESE